MHFLVIDVRFGTPIYVLLETDPQGAKDYPGLAVREVTLEHGPGAGVSQRRAIGRDPNHLDLFRHDRIAVDAKLEAPRAVLQSQFEGLC